jgi:peptidoglycan hydrolase-like protein with peptidoglycan-binding domain
MDPITILAIASLTSRLLGGAAETARNVKEIRNFKREMWGKVKDEVDANLEQLEDRYNVSWVQDGLNALSAADPAYGIKILTVDGRYGPATVDAVKRFQVKSGLVPDGLAGPLTLAAMITALQRLEAQAKVPGPVSGPVPSEE